MDQSAEVLLVAALKEAMARPEEQPLYKVGKQAGLFSSRTGPSSEAAQRAVRDGLLEVVRSDTRGKVETDFVRITPRGVQFVYQHESPKAVLEELLSALKVSREGLPRWVEEMQSHLNALTNRLEEMVERQDRQLQRLAQRTEEALKRLPGGPGPALSSWQLDALGYLDRRKTGSGSGTCPLSELFNALRETHGGLALAEFHEGLAALRDRGVLELVPYPGHLSELPEPEYALLEGAAVYYAASRR